MLNSPRYSALIAAAFLLGGAPAVSAQAAKNTTKAKPTHAQGKFKLTAPDLESKSRITAAHVFNGMGCNGQNTSPALNWSNAPAGTKSFAVTAYDPDAPTGSGWWHWVMYNIPADVTGLAAGAGNGRNAPLGWPYPAEPVGRGSDFHRHRETAHDIAPAIRELLSFDLVLERRDLGRSQVLVEHLAQIQS